MNEEIIFPITESYLKTHKEDFKKFLDYLDNLEGDEKEEQQDKLYIINDILDYDSKKVTIYNSYEDAINKLFKLERNDNFMEHYTLQVYKFDKETKTYNYETELSLKDLIING